MPPPSAALPQTRKARQRKALAIPKAFVPLFWQDADRRLHTAREIVRRVELLKRDSGADSYQKELLCQRAAFISLILETAEVKAGQTGELDLGSYVQGVNSLNGLLKHLGLERKVKRVGVTEYLGARAS